MNSIGIDFGRTTTSVCECEGDWRRKTSWQKIGDGKRQLIPNAVDGEGRWASAAVDANSPTLHAGFIEPVQGSWLEEQTTEMFLAGLARRIVAFLGRVEPVRRKGFEVVIAPHWIDYTAAENTISRTCRQPSVAAFEDAICIPPVRALLCRWAMERPSDGTRRVNAIVVYVGDTQSTVAGYEVEFSEGVARILRSNSLKALPERGSFGWEQAMMKDIADRSHCKLTAPMSAEILDAVRQIAVLMRRAEPQVRIPLSGQLADRMYQPMEFCRSEMATSMIEVNALTQPLSGLVEQSIHDMKTELPTEIIVGGIGAFWPFVFDSLSSLFALRGLSFWQSANPLDDVARGAALWPLFAGVAHAPWSDSDSALIPAPASREMENEASDQPASKLSLMDWMQSPPAD